MINLMRCRQTARFGISACCCLLITEACVAGDSICVRVKIEIEQTVTLERQAFRAIMKVSNGGESDLTGFRVAVNFLDEQGNAVSASTRSSRSYSKR